MSISYVTTQPMTLDQAIHRLKALGCTVEESEDRYAVVKDPDGNYFHLTDDIGSYSTLTFDLSSHQMTVAPTKILDGTTRVMGECYNVNDATRMAEVLDMVSEYEDEYDDIMGEAEEDEEALNPKLSQ
jgi:hypothetical protein